MRTNTTTEHKQWLWRFNLQIFSTDTEETEAQLNSAMYWILPGLWYFCSADSRFAAVVSEQIETVCSNVQQPLTRNANYSGTSDPAEELTAHKASLLYADLQQETAGEAERERNITSKMSPMSKMSHWFSEHRQEKVKDHFISCQALLIFENCKQQQECKM